MQNAIAQARVLLSPKYAGMAAALILFAVFATIGVIYKDELTPYRLARSYYEYLGQNEWSFLILAAFIAVGNVVFIPINLLLLATALITPGWDGFFVGMLGATMAAALEYIIGRQINGRFLKDKLGDRFEIIRQEIASNGISAVVAFCYVPIAPNTVTNIAAGIYKIPFWKLVTGTLIGFAPGVAMINLFSYQLRNMVGDPSFKAIAAGIGIVLLLGLSFVIGRRYKRRIMCRYEQGT